MPGKTQTTLGVFSERDDAEEAVSELNELGYSAKDLSIIVKDQDGKATSTGDKTKTDNVVEGAVSGATTGGVIGGIAGLLIGVGAIAIPGLGALLIAGPLAAALGLTGAAAATVSGAATGALAGGLFGSLTGLGVPEETAHYYEDRVKEGAVLIAVPTRDGIDYEHVRAIFKNHGADQIRTITV